jgi:hypothetical protein
MTDSLTLAELVEVGLDVAGRDRKVLMKEAEEVGLTLCLNAGGVGVGGFVLKGEEFDAIAGREDETFADAGLMEECAGGVGETFDGDGEALANLDGRGVVIDAEENEASGSGVVCGHGAVNL